MSNASYYYLYVNNSGTWYSAAQAGCGSGTGTCSITASSALATGSHTWWVQTYNSSGYGPWSSGMSFTISSTGGGFNEQFTSSPTNWSQSSGSWSWTGGDYWYTAGTAGITSTSLYTAADFTNFDYSAKLWRNDGSTAGSANRLWVRASSTIGSNGHPLNNYTFQYSANSQYSIFKEVNGVATTLQGWTASSAIATGSAWNTLRVYASGPSFYFWINGTLVWSGTDTTLSSGKVGVGMYRDTTSTGDGFWVDYATLSTVADMQPLNDKVPEAQLLLNQHPAGGGSANWSPN